MRGISDTLFKGFAFDAAWLVALALNQSTKDLKMVLGTTATLDKVPFGNKSFTVFLKKLILRTKFEGITVGLKGPYLYFPKRISLNL